MNAVAASLCMLMVLSGDAKSGAADRGLAHDASIIAKSTLGEDAADLPRVMPMAALPAAVMPVFAVVTPSKSHPRIDSEARLWNKHRWTGLTILQHGAATFDAWSTRVSITSGKGKELNPLMRPFSNSPAIYGVIQLAPIASDVWGRKMMRSNNGTYRRLWWLPQALGTAGFLFSGANNLRIAHSR